MGRLVVVSNRLPVTVEQTESGLRVQPSTGGLVNALGPILQDTQSTWIGWTGSEYLPGVEALIGQAATGNCALVPVFLTPAEKACFYHGCANEIIWPLFHDLQSRCNFDPAYWSVYSQVNEKFADAVEQTAHRDDFVWVHDYHLMLLAEAMRARDLSLRMAYFHHIPFPAPDIFEKLPWRCETLRGLLHYNALGFQTIRDRQNFLASVRRCLRDVHVKRIGERLLVRAEGLCTTVGAFPISIDFQTFAQAPESTMATSINEIRRSIHAEQIMLGIDRLDYTKGIPERLLAFRNLLERYSELRGRVVLVQVVVPSREDIPQYQELKQRIEGLVSQINGEHGTPGWAPVIYLHRHLSRSELVAFYRASDIALITPLKDGMNLVAKEFCASRVDDDGVLVLSEFAGAAKELKCGALLVNPYDAYGVASALYRAYRMSGREQRVRMQRMRRWIRRHDIFRWCANFSSQAVPRQVRPRPAALSLVAYRQAQVQVAGD